MKSGLYYGGTGRSTRSTLYTVVFVSLSLSISLSLPAPPCVCACTRISAPYKIQVLRPNRGRGPHKTNNRFEFKRQPGDTHRTTSKAKFRLILVSFLRRKRILMPKTNTELQSGNRRFFSFWGSSVCERAEPTLSFILEIVALGEPRRKT